MSKSSRSHFGHIQRVQSGKYRIFWEGTPKPDGRRTQHSKTIYGTLDDAEIALAKLRIACEGMYEDITYAEFWEMFTKPSFAKDNLALKTIDGYERVWTRELKPRIGKKVVSKTTYGFVEKTLAEIDSAWVQKAAHSLWRKMFNQAIREAGWNIRNPVDRYIRRKPAIPLDRPLLDIADVDTWLASIKDTAYEAAFLPIAGCGLRLEEGMPLLPDDVEPFKQDGKQYALIHLRRALVATRYGDDLKGLKNRFSLRDAVLGEPFVGRFLKLIPKSGALCPGKTEIDGELVPDNFLSTKCVTNNYRKHCKTHGFDYVNPGKFRKSWSMWQSEAGSQDSLIELAMGHAPDSTRGRNYMKYTKRAAIQLADALTNLYAETRKP